MLNNKIFVDRNGLHNKVMDVDGNIAIMEDGQRIVVERLLDTDFYKEASSKFTVNTVNQINESVNNNPVNIFDNPNRFHNYLNNINLKNINFNEISDNDTTPHIVMTENVVESRNTQPINNQYRNQQSQVITNMYDEEENTEKAMLDRAVKQQQELNKKIKQQQDKLSGLVDQDDIIPTTDDYLVKLHENNAEDLNQSLIFNPNQPIIKSTPKEEPISKMLNGIKKTDKFNINIKIEEMIPNKTLIKMWEESSDISMIDYLADEMFNKLMRNPEVIKEQIKDKLKNTINIKKKKEVEEKKEDENND